MASAAVVLVHGAFADGSSWSKVIPTLQEAGHHVVAVQLPLTSLEDDIEVTRRVLAAQEGPVVLVGHSYGGAVISGAGTAENVRALVYVAAYAPDEGESLLDVSARFPSTDGPTHFRPDAAGFVTVEQAAFPRAFAADVDPVQARVMAAVQKPAGGGNFAVKAGLAAWHTRPSWYLVSQHDQMIHPDLERWFATRMGATVREVPASHASLVSQPEVVIALIGEAARTVQDEA